MKKKFFGIILVVAVALFAGYTAYNSHGVIKLSNVTLANLEALAGEFDGSGSAGGESGGNKHHCYDRYSSADWFHKDDIFIWCQGCYQAKGHDLQDRNECWSND